MPNTQAYPQASSFTREKSRPSTIPREKTLDSTLALMKEGYRFISNRCRKFQSDIFETRLMFKKVICLQGEEAGEMFYGGNRMTRKAAVPMNTVTLLQDFGSVQTLDDKAHLVRKQMFMSLMAKASVENLLKIAEQEWNQQIPKWEASNAIVVHEAVQEIFCRAACRWAGLSLPDSEYQKRTKEFAAMIHGSGSAGFQNLRGQVLRTRSEHWARNVIQQIRRGQLDPGKDSPAFTIAWHRDLNGELLSEKIAGVELINLLRPTVAVARFVVFAALALHDHPESREKCRDDQYLEFFVQEVRRYYPFFPFIAGRVKEEFEFRGHHFHQKDWVIYDLYGTNHDSRIWQDPEVFNPERFRNWNGSSYSFVPQGGGDYLKGHRCPGEGITIALMKLSVRMLAFGVKYSVPPQSFKISFAQMPAIPESGFIIRNVNYGV